VHETEISFEFFPPRSPDVEARLARTLKELTPYAPRFASVTYGADGSSRDDHPGIVSEIRGRTGLDTAPHLSCINTPVAELRRLLDGFAALGVRRLVAVRGDLPEGGRPRGELRLGIDLVRFIRRHYGSRFRIHVGAYPECHPDADNFAADIARLREKVDAGADGVITQYFYNAEAYARFRDACADAGIDVPLVAGVMPIHDFGQITRFSARCGADIPRWLRVGMEACASAEERREHAADVVAALCERLIELGAPGFHVYTLNRAAPTRAVLSRLGIEPRGAEDSNAA
jgi:methylenetetrahydrofolate reductase (NADPH)